MVWIPGFEFTINLQVAAEFQVDKESEWDLNSEEDETEVLRISPKMHVFLLSVKINVRAPCPSNILYQYSVFQRGQDSEEDETKV